MSRTATACLIASLLCLPACKGRGASDNPDLQAKYRGSRYEQEIVEGRERRDYEDQGKAVSPGTLAKIQHVILNVYERDFERCMEDEMARHDTAFMSAKFLVEFKVSTEGKGKDPRVLESVVVRRKSYNDTKGEIVDTGPFNECVKAAVQTWEFDDKPEVEFTHTYSGTLGEAW